MVQIQLTVCFVNNALLEHSYAHNLHVVSYSSHATVAGLNSCDRHHMACKAENISRKRLLTPALYRHAFFGTNYIAPYQME